MYRGINAITVDDKGRLALPTRYREHFRLSSDNQVIVTIDTEESCLLLYTLNDWEEIEAKLEALPSFNPMARRIQRLLIGHATEISIDNNGRILLPQILRDYAKLDKQIVLIGQGKKFEIWDQKHWDSRRKTWLSSNVKTIKEIPDELNTLAL